MLSTYNDTIVGLKLWSILGTWEITSLKKNENQDDDALGKIKQQQALSFRNCSQREWEPHMMSKEKETSSKVGIQMFKKVPIGDLGTKNSG